MIQKKYKVYLVAFIDYKTHQVCEWGIYGESAKNLTVEIGRVFPVDICNSMDRDTIGQAQDNLIDLLSCAPHYFYDWLADIRCITPEVFWSGMTMDQSFWAA